MLKNPSPSTINQTAIGNENIQVVGSHNVITRVTNFFAGGTEQERAYRDRRRMLELVRNTWIKGVLEKSLYNEVLIDLAMDTLPGKVDHPWDLQIEMPDQIKRTLPAGTSMIDVFDEMNGAMLILGEAGSGKTTMLLELARDCIGRAMQDDNQPVPVFFNLSSWDGKQSLEDWLIKELWTKYNVPIKTAQSWVMNDYLQLLLDGLDEVKPEHREKCVEAIDQFRKEHGLTTPIAVCSRTAEYEALTGRLDLQGAVLLQPLTAQQIDKYFEQVGPKLEGVHQILKKDEILQELARQPLMLSIMTLAYQDRSADALASSNMETIEIRRNHLFDTYIEKMFGRVARTKNQLYAPEQTKAWLAWLGRKIMVYNQVPFHVEGLQPKWLDQSKKRIFSGFFGLFSYLIAGLTLAFVFNILLDRVVIGPREISRGAPTMGVIISLLLWLNDRLRVPIIWNWKKRLFMGLISGLILQRLPGIDGAMTYGVLISLGFGWLESLSEIKTADRMSWSWRKAIGYGMIFAIIIGLISGFLEGFIVGLVIAVAYAVFHGEVPPDQMVNHIVDWIAAQSMTPIPPELLEFINNLLLSFANSLTIELALKIGLFVWVSQALINAILVAPFVALIQGFNNQQLGQTTYPGQRLVHSYRNSIRILLSTALLAGGIALVNYLVNYFVAQYLIETPIAKFLNGMAIENEFSMELFLELIRGLITILTTELIVPIAILMMLSIGISLMLYFAFAFGLIGVLRFGGITLLQHYALRLVIVRNNYLPWRLIPFLDYCVDRVLLRRVGGGYIFVHRLLMEHFAAMYSESERAKEPATLETLSP